MIFKDFIFSLFPSYYKEKDTYQDSAGEGLFERYTRCFGEEIDREILPPLENYLGELDPRTASSAILQHLSDCLGNPPDIFLNEGQYRNMLRYAVDVYKIKGTEASYQLLFSLLGFNTTLIQYPAITYLYDDGWFYDDAEPYYDSVCPLCSEYSILFSNTLDPLNPISLLTLSLLESIIYWVEPINARLRSLINNIQTIDQAYLCIKENINIKKLYYKIYDELVFFDDGNSYDELASVTVMQTINFNCNQLPDIIGIGFDTIGFDLIVY